MNDYLNMNYFTTNYNNKYPYLNKQQFHNLKNTVPNYQTNQQDSELIKKLKKQAGNNMKFNENNYYQKIDPNNIYDVYNGYIRGNMFPELYNQYKIKKPYEIMPMNKQAELLTKLDAYGFAAHELNLYLDNNPMDKEAIKLFKDYTKQKKQFLDEYENNYGPLFVESSTSYPWAWNESPWPWENK